jgi:hypothetical protein
MLQGMRYLVGPKKLPQQAQRLEPRRNMCSNLNKNQAVFIAWPCLKCGALTLKGRHTRSKTSDPTRSLVIAHPHLLVWATSERFLPALVTSSGSHWLNQL